LAQFLEPKLEQFCREVAMVVSRDVSFTGTHVRCKIFSAFVKDIVTFLPLFRRIPGDQTLLYEFCTQHISLSPIDARTYDAEAFATPCVRIAVAGTVAVVKPCLGSCVVQIAVRFVQEDFRQLGKVVLSSITQFGLKIASTKLNNARRLVHKVSLITLAVQDPCLLQPLRERSWFDVEPEQL
jgi:hypothetical protein